MAARVWSFISGFNDGLGNGYSYNAVQPATIAPPFSIGAVFVVQALSTDSLIFGFGAPGTGASVGVVSGNLVGNAGTAAVVGPAAVVGHVIHAHLNVPDGSDPELFINGLSVASDTAGWVASTDP